jgi:hypothetical protein
MFFSKLFNRNQPEIGVDRGKSGNVFLPEGAPVYSEPPGFFSMYIVEEAMALIEAEGRLTREEVASLPNRVYQTAKKLGVLRAEPMHFILNVNGGRLPTESAMTVAKIVPPIIAKNGTEVSRSLLIFAPPFRFDMSKAENDFAAAKDQIDALSPQAVEKIKDGFIQARRMNCVTSLCHELVHIFVTDEYMARFKGWSLARLELLTDAITVEAVYPIVERSQDDFVKMGFIHGAAYLSNQIRKTLGDHNPNATVIAIKARSQQIIREEQKALAN